MNSGDLVWSLIAPGHATAVLGGGLPAAPTESVVVTIPCDRPQRDLGAVLEARRRIERRIGQSSSLWDLAADRVRNSIRQRLLADEPEPERAWLLVEPLNRLQEECDVPAILVFDIVEAADAASLSLLEEVVGHPGRAGAALVFTVRDPTDGGPAMRLLDTVRRVEGGSRVVDLRSPPPSLPSPSPPPPPPPPPPPRPVPRPDLVPETAPASTWAHESLPRDLRRVLRAAVVVGDCFEAEFVAGLLRVSELEVLELLQDLIDQGAPLRDLGDGAFQVAPALATSVRSGIQPSLAVAWNLRLAELLGASPGRRTPTGAVPGPSPVKAGEDLTITTEVPPIGAIPDPARAAAHLEAAGEPAFAAKGFLHAAREAMAFGADEQAAHHARRALELLGTGSTDVRRRAMRSEARMIVAFVNGDEDALTSALAAMAEAQRRLSASDPALAAELEHTERLLGRITTFARP